MINIAIDGPSGGGKSHLAKALAKKLGYTHLDTGAMYRSVAYKCINKGLDLQEEYEDQIVDLISKMDLDMKKDGSVILDGNDISKLIRTPEISMGASNVSKLKKVREALVAMQQKIASKKGYILDGRDICSVVLPDAEVKFFLTASPEVRAKRRLLQNEKNGIKSDYNEILEAIIKRDYQDSNRENSPLKQTEDALLIDSSNINREEVLELALKEVNKYL